MRRNHITNADQLTHHGQLFGPSFRYCLHAHFVRPALVAIGAPAVQWFIVDAERDEDGVPATVAQADTIAAACAMLRDERGRPVFHADGSLAGHLVKSCRWCHNDYCPEPGFADAENGPHADDMAEPSPYCSFCEARVLPKLAHASSLLAASLARTGACMGDAVPATEKQRGDLLMWCWYYEPAATIPPQAAR